MSRPWKHPKTGVYYLRKRVPAELRETAGCETIKKSLGTKDPTQAKIRFLAELQKLECRWANLRLGERRLTEREAHILAERYQALWFTLNREEPSSQNFWRNDLYDRLWTAPTPDLNVDRIPREVLSTLADDLWIGNMRAFCARGAAHCLQSNGLTVDPDSRNKLERAVGAAYQRASKILKRQSEGYDLDTDVSIFAKRTEAEPKKSSAAHAAYQRPDHAAHRNRSSSFYSITDMVADWWNEAKSAGRKNSTFESYRNTAKLFVDFVGHNDTKQITADDIVAFKDFRLRTPSAKTRKIPSAKTVKDSDLSALKTLFGWAVANRKIEVNPALGITIKLAKPKRLRPKGFTYEEAKAILTQASLYSNPKEHPKTVAAKRWVPWLCAFTGARVGEIAQLREQDVSTDDDRWIIRITPEAGTVKTNEARQVVLHRQIVELGFPTFAKANGAGPLFLRPDKEGSVLGPLQGLKNRLAEFAREIVPDPHVAPNHGWRHRFKTVGMEAGIAPRILDAIQGQAARSVADTYGEVTLKTIAAAIDRLPEYNIFI